MVASLIKIANSQTLQGWGYSWGQILKKSNKITLTFIHFATVKHQ